MVRTIVLENHFELYDAVVIDMNGSYSSIHSTTMIAYKKSYTYEKEEFKFDERRDTFAIGVLFAQYLKLILTGDEEFMKSFSKFEDYRQEILDFVRDMRTYEMFLSHFGRDYANCFKYLKAIVKGSLSKGCHRMNMKKIRRYVLQLKR